MSILEIELTPDMEKRLWEKALRRGQSAPAYAQSLLLASLQQKENKTPKRSIMELEGLGAELWKNEDGSLIDAQQYVNELRREWDHRP